MNAVGATTVEAPGGRSLRTLFRKRRRADRGVSFPELAWVHHLRQQELSAEHHGPYEGPAEQRYREFVERFEAANGEIVSQYWCTTEASGIALTIRRRPLLLADTVRLHWATDWSTKDKPKLMRLLYECETLAVKVQEVLRDTSRRLAIQSLFNVISFVLAGTFFFVVGAWFCYVAVFPVGYAFFLEEYRTIGVAPQIRISEYLSFASRMLLAFGVTFELPVVTFFLARFGIVTHQMLISWFRYAIVVIFIVAAVLTPGPDAASQFLMATPLCVLYGMSIGVAYFFGRGRTTHASEDEAPSGGDG